jgi:hypothetical protein
VRLLQVDTLLARTVAQWVYLPEPLAGRGKMSALSFVNASTLLAVETSSTGSRVYALELGGATSVLGGAFDSPAGSTLDVLDARGLAHAGINPVAKTLLLDLGPLTGPGSRIEGLTIVDADTIAVGTDDGFGLAAPPSLLAFDAYADPTPARPASSQVLTIRLGASLPLGR